MYSAEDYVAMRKNANRGMWLSLAIIWAVLGVVLYWALHAFADETGTSLWTFETVGLLVLFAVLTIGCLVKAYRKESFGAAANGSGGNLGGGDFGDFGGD